MATQKLDSMEGAGHCLDCVVSRDGLEVCSQQARVLVGKQDYPRGGRQVLLQVVTTSFHSLR